MKTKTENKHGGKRQGAGRKKKTTYKIENIPHTSRTLYRINPTNKPANKFI